MKSFFIFVFTAVLLVSTAQAADTPEIFGTVSLLNLNAQTFSVQGESDKTYSFVTNDETQIDVRNENYRENRFYQLMDVRDGDLVQVKYYPSEKQPYVVDSMDVFR